MWSWRPAQKKGKKEEEEEEESYILVYKYFDVYFSHSIDMKECSVYPPLIYT